MELPPPHVLLQLDAIIVAQRESEGNAPASPGRPPPASTPRALGPPPAPRGIVPREAPARSRTGRGTPVIYPCPASCGCGRAHRRCGECAPCRGSPTCSIARKAHTDAEGDRRPAGTNTNGINPEVEEGAEEGAGVAEGAYQKAACRGSLPERQWQVGQLPYVPRPRVRRPRRAPRGQEATRGAARRLRSRADQSSVPSQRGKRVRNLYTQLGR